MGKCFLTDKSATVGQILMIYSRDPHEILMRESVLYSEQKKNTSIVVDDTSTGALQPGEANLTQAQTMDQFQEDKVRPGIVENTYIDT